jgi:hypothetical protein
MDNKRKQKHPSSPSVARFFNQIQRVFKADEFKQIVVRF